MEKNCGTGIIFKGHDFTALSGRTSYRLRSADNSTTLVWDNVR